jgi:hypothetical protein
LYLQVEAQQFGPEALQAIFAEAEKMEKVKPGTPEAKVSTAKQVLRQRRWRK